MSLVEDEAAIRPLNQQLMDGWNKGSAELFAAPFTEDADFIAFDGSHFKGRGEIATSHRPLFDKWLKGTRLVGEIKSVRFLSHEVAMMHVLGGTIMRGKLWWLRKAAMHGVWRRFTIPGLDPSAATFGAS